MMQQKTQNNSAHNASNQSEFLFKVPNAQGTALKFAWSTKAARANPPGDWKSAHTLSST